MNGREGDLIHTFNKHEASHKSRTYFKSIKVTLLFYPCH